jgi:hypothetical protein
VDVVGLGALQQRMEILSHDVGWKYDLAIMQVLFKAVIINNYIVFPIGGKKPSVFPSLRKRS